MLLLEILFWQAFSGFSSMSGADIIDDTGAPAGIVRQGVRINQSEIASGSDLG
jgi:hypothetical protein